MAPCGWPRSTRPTWSRWTRTASPAWWRSFACRVARWSLRRPGGRPSRPPTPWTSPSRRRLRTASPRLKSTRSFARRWTVRTSRSRPCAVTLRRHDRRKGGSSRPNSVPLLTHVSMEPICCTAESTPERTELWIGTQGHDVLRMTLERALQVPADRLFINTTYLGGGFGRKTHGEIALQAALASRAVNGRPVKVLWAREDDVQQGQYRQTMMCRFRATLDDAGSITAMRIRLAGPQMGRDYGFDPEQLARVTGNLANFDPFSLGGLSDMHYVIPNFVVEHAVVDLPIPLCPWRSISHSFTGFFFESFMDECTTAAGRDPLEFRRGHLAGQARMLAVLDRVAEMSRWREAAPDGTARGLAVVESYGSYVAQVVEARRVGGRLKVDRVHAAIDCGRAINPGQVETQIQGAVIDALSAALRQKITIRDGRAEQSNFYDYPLLRIEEAPSVAVSIVETGSPLGGVGEPGVPPLAPALANALFAATRQRVRSLPLSDHG
ncbi:MAG: molybdopterin-dependent oxidoreductase [Kiloniellaceae bacterium]|nr:molybdopterin-dependent oxidoreductase [Kiloniellaceae bacterium]